MYRVTNSDKDIHLKPSAITLCDISQWLDKGGALLEPFGFVEGEGWDVQIGVKLM